jgi:Fe-S-cluster containining protein
MSALKETILKVIYEKFDKWGAGIPVVCEKKCAVCCTQNVTMTAVEGDLIHALIREQGWEPWFAGQLQKKGETRRPEMTTNQFAGLCFEGKDVVPESYGNLTSCPFLDDACCTIYEVRPFACRSFVSQNICSSGSSAVVPDYYLSAVSAVMQIIEHLGQGEYWGNMLDVLPALCDLPENRKYLELLPASFVDHCRANLVSARPLPGFLIPEEDWDKVSSLLTTIFSTKIGEKTVENILNGG